MTALWIIFGILLFIIILFLIHIKVCIDFFYNENANEAQIEIRYLFFRIKLKPKEASADKTEKKNAEKDISLIESFKFFAGIYDDLKKVLNRFISYFIKHALTIHTLNISAVIGTNEAMKTGLLTGAANAAAYSIVSAMKQNMKLKAYNISINGEFGCKCLKFGISCVLSTNIMHIAVCGVMLLKLLLLWRMRKNDKSGN